MHKGVVVFSSAVQGKVFRCPSLHYERWNEKRIWIKRKGVDLSSVLTGCGVGGVFRGEGGQLCVIPKPLKKN